MMFAPFIRLFMGGCISSPGEVVVLKKSTVIWLSLAICALGDSV